jgi:hypothetical protein
MMTTRRMVKAKFRRESKFVRNCDSSISVGLFPNAPPIRGTNDVKYNTQEIQKSMAAIIASMRNVAMEDPSAWFASPPSQVSFNRCMT